MLLTNFKLIATDPWYLCLVLPQTPGVMIGNPVVLYPYHEESEAPPCQRQPLGRPKTHSLDPECIFNSEPVSDLSRWNIELNNRSYH